jgi:hypothetical protein
MRILCGLDSQYRGQISLTAGDKNIPIPDDINVDGKKEKADKSSKEDMKGEGFHGQEDMETEPDTPKFYNVHVNDDLRQFIQDPQNDRRPPQSDSFISLGFRWIGIGIQYLIKIASKVNSFTKFKFMDMSEENKLRRCVGWCPQEDALFEYLTVLEHIELFDALLGGSTNTDVDISGGREEGKHGEEDKYGEDENEGSGDHRDTREGFNHDVSRRMDKLFDVNNQDIERDETRAKNEKWSLNSISSSLRCFLSISKQSKYDESSAIVLSRLGMLEHADKYVLALSGMVNMFLLYIGWVCVFSVGYIDEVDHETLFNAVTILSKYHHHHHQCILMINKSHQNI